MTKCYYHKCGNNRGSEVPMFRFPIHDKERLKLWIKNSGYSGLESCPGELRNKFVCAEHFRPSHVHVSAHARMRLKADAVPVAYDNFDEQPSQDVIQVKKPPKCYSKPTITVKDESDSETSITLLCRICFVEDRNMKNIVGTYLQNIYERLTGTPFVRIGISLQVCYICYARLRNCYKLQSTCLQSELLLTQGMKKNKYNMFSKLKADIRNKITLKNRPVIIWDSHSNCLNDSNDCDIGNVKTEPLDEMEDIAQDIKEEPIIGERLIKSDEITIEENGKLQHIPSTSQDVSVEDIVKIELPALENIPHDQVVKNSEHNDNIVSQDDTYSNDLHTITNSMDPWVLKNNDIIIEEIESLYHDLPTNTDEDGPVGKKLKTMMNTQRPMKPYNCDKCEKTFIKRYKLDAHRAFHNITKPYECETCGKYYSNKSSLLKHMHNLHEMRHFQCDVCQKVFTKSYGLKVHHRIHTGEKPYKCDICQKSFYWKNSIQVHYKMHDRRSDTESTCEEPVESEIDAHT